MTGSTASQPQDHVTRRLLTEPGLAQVLRQLVGERVPRALVTVLHKRTDGSPARILDVLHGAIVADDDAVTVDSLCTALGRPAAGSADDAVIRREGDFWTVRYCGAVARLRHTRGIEYLARLLHQPAHRFHALELWGRRGYGGPGDAERARLAVAKGLSAALARVDAALPELARHLRATVRRGYHCSYTPDPSRPVRWRR